MTGQNKLAINSFDECLVKIVGHQFKVLPVAVWTLSVITQIGQDNPEFVPQLLGNRHPVVRRAVQSVYYYQSILPASGFPAKKFHNVVYFIILVIQKSEQDYPNRIILRQPLGGLSVFCYFSLTSCSLYSRIVFSSPKYSASAIRACPIETSFKKGIRSLKYFRFSRLRSCPAFTISPALTAALAASTKGSIAFSRSLA